MHNNHISILTDDITRTQNYNYTTKLPQVDMSYMQAVLSGGHHISASFTQDPGIFIVS